MHNKYLKIFRTRKYQEHFLKLLANFLRTYQVIQHQKQKYYN